MARTKHSTPTEFAYPVDRICGKISRHSKVVHACTASGKKITYLQGQRNYLAHPVTPKETEVQSLFKRRQAAVNARVKKTSETYAADMAAYEAQLKSTTPVVGFQKYLWSLVKSEIPE